MSGDVPDTWAVKTIGEMATITMGQSPPSSTVSDDGEGLPFIQGNAEFGARYPKLRQFAADCPKVVEGGDILLSVRAPVGEVNVAPERLCIGRGLAGLRPTDGDHDFLYYALGGLAPVFARLSQGSTFDAINGKDLRSIPLLVPPHDEQRRIAEVLRSVDVAIASADLALMQAKVVRRTTINELLSSGGELAEQGRLSCRLSEVLSIAHGFPFKSEYFTVNRDDPILLTPGNFSVEKTLYFGERTKHYSGPVPDGYVLEDGSLVVVMTDLTQDMAILGNAVEISGNGVVLHNQRIGRVSVLRPDLITKGYARLLLNSDIVQSRVKSTASGSTVRHTAPSRILECEVQLPPLDDQARIVDIAKSLDDIVSAEERRRSDDEVTGPLSHLIGLKAKVAADLLSGRVRVPA